MPIIGIVLAILSGALLVSRNYHGKKLTNHGFKPFQLLLAYNFIGFIVLSLYVFFALALNPNRQLPGTFPLPTIILYLIIYSISGYLYFYLMKKLPISTMVPLFGSLPIFSAVTALFFLNEVLHPIVYLGIIITSLGSILISFKAHRSKHEPTNHTLLSIALFTTILFAFQSVVQKKLITAIGIDLTLWFTYAGISLVYSPFIFVRIRRHKIYRPSYLSLLIYCFTGIACLAATFASFRLIPIGIAIALNNTALPLSVLVGKHFFAEKHARTKLLGSLFIACGAAIITLFH